MCTETEIYINLCTDELHYRQHNNINRLIIIILAGNRGKVNGALVRSLIILYSKLLDNQSTLTTPQKSLITQLNYWSIN